MGGQVDGGAYVFERSQKARGRRVRRALAAARVAEAVGPLARGCEIFGLSKGQFSMFDLLAHALDATGPAEVTIATWAAGGADLKFAYEFLADGRIRSLRFLIDESFARLQPSYLAALVERFGRGAVRLTKTHAKFATVINGDWGVVLRGSMNFNENYRLEQFEISDDQALARYLVATCDSLFEEIDADRQFRASPGEHREAFRGWFGDEERDRDLQRIGWSSQKTGRNIG